MRKGGLVCILAPVCSGIERKEISLSVAKRDILHMKDESYCDGRKLLCSEDEVQCKLIEKGWVGVHPGPCLFGI